MRIAFRSVPFGLTEDGPEYDDSEAAYSEGWDYNQDSRCHCASCGAIYDIASDGKARLYLEPVAEAEKAEGTGREGSLAAIIDPLLNDQHTVKEIAAETPQDGAESPKTKPPLPQNGEGTAVCVSRENWRGRRNQFTDGLNPAPVPAPEKAYIFPAFSLNWFVTWDRIRNGERVVLETALSPDRKTIDFDIPEFKCRRALESTMGAIPIGLCPEGATSGYARLPMRQPISE